MQRVEKLSTKKLQQKQWGTQETRTEQKKQESRREDGRKLQEEPVRSERSTGTVNAVIMDLDCLDS